MTTVNRVDCVIHRPLHHGEAQYREGVRLSPVTTIALDAIAFQSVTASAPPWATLEQRAPVR